MFTHFKKISLENEGFLTMRIFVSKHRSFTLLKIRNFHRIQPLIDSKRNRMNTKIVRFTTMKNVFQDPKMIQLEVW